MADAVVIGAGIGGLSAAIALAARGREVVVLEAADRPGGKAGVVELDGVRCDTGPSVLTLPETLDGLLREAGTSLAERVTLLRPSPGFRYLWPDGVALDVAFDPADTLRNVAGALGADAAGQLEAFLAYARRIWELAAPAFVEGEAPGPSTVWKMRSAGLSALWTLDPFRTMDGGIDRFVREPHLRDLLRRYATYNGSDPRRAPATLNCIAHVELALGCYGIAGGMGALVDALVGVATGLGVTLETGAAVGGVILDGGRVAGVRRVDGPVVRAPQVVCNADVAHLVADLLPPGAGPTAPTERSTSGWTAICSVPRTADRRPHEVIFPPDYDAEFQDLFDRRQPPRVPTVYLSATDRAHRVGGWGDREPVFVMANTPAEADGAPTPSERWVAFGEAVVQRAVDAGRLSDPQLRWVRTPAGLAGRFPRTGGALYGAASNSPLSAFQRPANRVRSVPGLYLASGSAHPGGGVPLCVLSGRAAARAALEDRP